MPALTTDIMSIDDLKVELQVEASDNTRNARIGRAFSGAIDWVGKQIGTPLLDTEKTLYFNRPDDGNWVIDIIDTTVLSITSISYWEKTQKIREEPAGQITIAGLGRQSIYEEGYLVWPPSAGWPSILEDSTLKFVVKVGIGPTVPPGIQSALILATRQLFEGYTNIRPTGGIMTFLSAYQRGRW